MNQVMFHDLGNTWSSEYHVNKMDGKLPYVKNGYQLEEVDLNRTIPKNALFLDPTVVDYLNEMGKDIRSQIEAFNNVLDENI
jgi:hypothetical protein